MPRPKNGTPRPARKEPMEARSLALAADEISNGFLKHYASVANPDSKNCCWPWPGLRDKDGYGRWAIRKSGTPTRYIRAHRGVYALHHGAAPAGLVIRHTCDNPPCVNPEHLIVGTIADNSSDMLERHRGRWSGLTKEECRAKSWQFKRGKNPQEKAVIGPDGRRWISGQVASEELGVSKSAISMWCITGRYGWRFA